MQRAGTTRAEEIQREKLILARLWSWLQNCLDYHVSRNQVFYSQGDYIWAMLIALGMNRRTVFKLTTLIVQDGITAAVPFVVIAFILTWSMLLTDTHAGFFSGTGIVSITQKICPFFSGIGTAYTIYGFYQILRDFGDISLITFFTFRSMWDTTEKMCSTADRQSFFKTKVAADCISVHDAFCWCSNNQTVDYTARPGLPAYSEKIYWEEESKGFAGGVMVSSLVSLLFVSLLTLVNVRKFTRAIRWVVGPAVAVEALILLTAGLRFRLSGNFPCCPMWADLAELFSWDLVKTSGVTTVTVWVYSSFLAMEMLGAATCLASGLSRRMAQGAQYTPFLITVVTLGVWFHIIFALLYLLVAPTVVQHNSNELDGHYVHQYPSYAYSKIFLWDCVLFAAETIKAAGMSNLSVVLVWISVVAGIASRLFYNIDCLRNCTTEYLSRWGNEEETIDAWRSRVGPLFLLIAFFVGTARFISPIGVIIDETVRNEIKESICRMVCCALMIVVFYGFYGEKKIAKDHWLVTNSRVDIGGSFLRMSRLILNIGIYPVVVLLMFVGLSATYEEMFGLLLPLPELLGNTYTKKDSNMRFWLEVGGWTYAAGPLLAIVCQALWALWSSLRRGKHVRLLFQTTLDWGPSEMRFWEGRYKHLFYDQGIVLDEEKDLQRVVLRMGKRVTGLEPAAEPRPPPNEPTANPKLTTDAKKTK